MVGRRLQNMTWQEAETALQADPIVVLPVGGGTKQHGHHLPLGTDLFFVEEIAERITKEFPILLLPTLSYAYYPAFSGWPGSISLDGEIFKNLAGDIIRNIAGFGAKKFLILDVGVSTHPLLCTLSYDLHNELGIYVAVTNILGLGHETAVQICKQEYGSHADELETSCILAIRPDLVKMDLATKDNIYRIEGTYGKNDIRKICMGVKLSSKTGTYGDPALATKEKGEKILQAITDDILLFLQNFQHFSGQEQPTV